MSKELEGTAREFEAELAKAKKMRKQNTPQVDAYGHQYWSGFMDAMLFTQPLLTRVQVEARLEEAKWWDSHDDDTEADATAKVSRLATLAQAAAPATKEG